MVKSGQSTVCGVLLAAGMSERFGEHNKLLAEIDGTPLVRRVAERLLASRLAGTVVVTGFESERVTTALAGLELRFVHNPDYRDGMASSLRAGIAAMDETASGAMILLGDMPGVTTDLVDRLLDAFESEGGDKITFPVDTHGRQGNPVIWPRAFFTDMSALTGDKGAKGLIDANRDATLEVPVDGRAAFGDIDARSDLSGWKTDGGA